MRTRLLSLAATLSAALLLVAIASATPTPATLTLPLRVHILSSARNELDAKPIVDREVVVARLAEINETFAPAGIRWQLEGLAVERVEPGPSFERVRSGGAKPGTALAELVDASKMLAPHGWDLYVARNLSALKVGGAYICQAGGARGQGAAFISAVYGNGDPFPVRKWSHELGHSLGLAHTPCDAEHADQLMMSGKCSHAGSGREALTAAQIARARKVAESGGPHPCKGSR